MIENQISIRRIDEEKSSSSFFLPTILEIESQVNPSPWSKADILSEFNNPTSSIFGLFKDQILIGFAMIRTLLDESEIMEIAIKGEEQRKGFGFQLLDFSIRNLPDGVKRVTLEVRSNNRPAIGLYETLGFAPVGMRKGYYSDPPDNAILMTKVLN